MRNTGDRLKECRIMKGLSRGEMSEMLHVSTDYLARLETGTQPVTYRIIEKVAKLEGWNSDYILHGIDNNNPFSELHTLCPDFRKKVFIRNLLCLFDSMLQFGYKKERVVAYYHRMILEIVNGMELDVPDNVRTGYTLTEIRRIHDMNKKDMANVLGISERSYCTLENGLSRPDIKILQIVYDMYGFNVQYFLTRNPLDCEAVEIYRTDQQVLNTLTDIQDGCWINMVDPTSKELEQIAERFEIEPEDISSALDEEESSRISLEDGYTVILVDIPTPEVRHEKKMYTTIPLGIILKSEAIITVCKVDTPIINYFVRNKVKEFSTKKKMRFIYQMLFRSAFVYQANLRLIDKKRIEIEERVDGDTSDTDLIELHELESTLVYFATSLRANSIVLERLRRYKRLEQYPEDMELLEDVMVEYQQAIEMTTIYRDVIDGTRELMSSVIDSKLNNVMKYLTSITIVMAIPTIISGIYGMNVGGEWMPFAKTPFGFEIISGIILLICIIVLWVLRKKKML